MNDIAPHILEQAAQGDIASFEQIYRNTSGFVYNVALRITRNSQDAEEVTQNVFMKVYRNLKNFGFRSAFKTWVYRITVNTAINQYRSSKREVERRADYDNVVETLADPHQPLEAALNSDNESKLNALLEPLSQEHRTCLILREIEGLSYQEMAVALGIPVNTVRSRLKRARQALFERARKDKKNAMP